MCWWKNGLYFFFGIIDFNRVGINIHKDQIKSQSNIPYSEEVNSGSTLSIYIKLHSVLKHYWFFIYGNFYFNQREGNYHDNGIMKIIIAMM